jgi:hypothetical protein
VRAFSQSKSCNHLLRPLAEHHPLGSEQLMRYELEEHIEAFAVVVRPRGADRRPHVPLLLAVFCPGLLGDKIHVMSWSFGHAGNI